MFQADEPTLYNIYDIAPLGPEIIRRITYTGIVEADYVPGLPFRAWAIRLNPARLKAKFILYCTTML